MARPRAFDEDTVLDHALNLFWHRGYEATSMQNLVDALEINRASLYDTFGDKYQLYRRVLERYRQRNQAFVDSLFAQNRPASTLLRELLDRAVSDSVSDCACKGCFIVNSAVELAPHDADIARFVADNQTAFIGKLRQLIERGQREGDINPAQSASDIAHFMYAAYSGLKVMSKYNPNEATLHGIVSVTMAAIKNG